MFSVLMGLPLLFSCQDQLWEEHYGKTTTESQQNAMEVLRQDGHFTKFCALLEATGMDSVLQSAQTFTIWAPTDQALSNYTLDEHTVKQLIKNHVSRFVYGRNDLVDTASMRIQMLNGKYHWFERQGSALRFAGIDFMQKGIPAKNAIIYPMDALAPFLYNLWERTAGGPDTDSLYSYLSGFDTYTFMPTWSTPIGKNKYGQTVYDSVFDYRNDWARRFGFVYLEDSIYTMIVPKNNAWVEAYSRIEPYFKTFGSMIADNSSTSSIIVRRTYQTNDAIADSIARAHTKEVLVQDLVFRKVFDVHQVDGDSLFSSSGNVFHHPAYLFERSSPVEASNGRYYLVDKLLHKPIESWHKPILVEAEQQSGRAFNYASIVNRSTVETAFVDSVSGLSYLEVNPTSTNALFQPQVSFDIPNVLAATYNIYVVCAPPQAYDSLAAEEVTKLQFYLNYVHADGSMKEDAAIRTMDGTEFITNGRGMTRFLVAKEFTFPFANYTTSPFSETDKQTVNVKIRIMTNVRAAETAVYNRTMRIDYILFEPVTKESNE